MSAALLPAAAPPTKAALEELLRARRLQAEAPPLRGEDRRHVPIATGIAAVDALLGGGLRRGEMSELFGSASSGRTGLALALAAGVTRRGALVAWVDPADRLDPASAAAAGIDLSRLLWLRGAEARAGARPLSDTMAATATLLGSGLFDLVVLDLLGVPDHDRRRLPFTTWTRLGRAVEGTSTAFLLLSAVHRAQSPGGASLALTPRGPCFSGTAGPGRLLRGLAAEVAVGRHVPRRASLRLHASC
ncbi:MAG TPA: hypothetical protein VLL75_07225 [Vicinamibacteria bacterium]|nr:hypothetical protein [Vicinamibacteria bacterium]